MLHEVIIDYITRNRSAILSFAASLEGEEELPEVDWRFLPPSQWPGPIAGVDGSVNAIEYKGCLFAVANAEAVAATGEGVSRAAAGGFADFILPYWLPRERAKTYMTILELRAALETLRNLKGSLVLMDGSLLNIFPKSLRRYYSSALAAEYEDRVAPAPCNGYCDSSVRGIVRGLAAEGLDVQEARRRAATLELLELIVLLRELLSRYSGRIVWVAKNSTDTSLFKGVVSDIAIIERVTRGRGYMPAGVSQLEPPPGTAASSFLGNVDVPVYYARLGDRGPVLRVEAPLMGERYAERVVGSLMAVSAAGYPYVLRRAHRDVLVRKRDIEALARLLGLKVITPARWYL